MTRQFVVHALEGSIMGNKTSCVKCFYPICKILQFGKNSLKLTVYQFTGINVAYCRFFFNFDTIFL